VPREESDPILYHLLCAAVRSWLLTTGKDAVLDAQNDVPARMSTGKKGIGLGVSCHCTYRHGHYALTAIFFIIIFFASLLLL